MKIRSRRVGLVAIVVLATALLAGCAAASPKESPAPAKPTASEAEKTPTPTPSAAVAAVAEVIVTSTAIEIRDDQGELVATYDYFQPTGEVVEGLTEAFGAAPVTTPFAGAIETSAGNFHDWGGFRLFDTDREPEGPHYANHSVFVTSAIENGVSIRTVDGIAVGDNAEALEAAYPDTSNRITVTGQSERLDIFVGHSPLPEMTPGSGESLSFSVWLIAPDPAGVVTEFRAPSPNFGV